MQTPTDTRSKYNDMTVKSNPVQPVQVRNYRTSTLPPPNALATIASFLAELPKGPVELVVSALDNHEHGHLRGQPWFVGAVAWAEGERARCLALDPPREGPSVHATWSLGLVLPLALPPSCGQHYLCDVGIPSGVFARLGIEYSSPFSHKFFVALVSTS